MLNGVNDLQSLLGPPPRKENTGSNNLEQDDFFTLMIAQLSNQDPTKPQDGTEFLSQLAQFGTVNGISELQESFNLLASSLGSNQALMAAGMIDREVLVPSSTGYLENEGTLEGRVDMPYAASDVTVRITDQGGALIRTLNLGSRSGGPVEFNWDGRNDLGQPMVPGRYNVEIQATVAGENYALQPMIRSRVESVALGGYGGDTLVTLAGLGQVSLNDIREIG